MENLLSLLGNPMQLRGQIGDQKQTTPLEFAEGGRYTDQEELVNYMNSLFTFSTQPNRPIRIADAPEYDDDPMSENSAALNNKTKLMINLLQTGYFGKNPNPKHLKNMWETDLRKIDFRPVLQ
tara:strand:- start:7984 stop:8352 length:369 start_codon:yes stop_codon:yes gene_type:complete